jgi:hypothetical protein
MNNGITCSIVSLRMNPSLIRSPLMKLLGKITCLCSKSPLRLPVPAFEDCVIYYYVARIEPGMELCTQSMSR